MNTRALIAAAGLLALAGCGTSTTSGAAPPVPSSTTAPAQPSDCMTQYLAWKPTGQADNTELSNAMGAVGTDNTNIGNDLQNSASTTADGNKLARDLGTLEGVTARLKNDMPPACIPNLGTDYGNALDDVQNMASANILVLGALDKGNNAQADTYSQVENGYITKTQNDISAATNDVTAFTSSQGSY